MSMPGMGGAQLLTELRRIRPSVPVILATGFLQGADAGLGGELFDGTVLKPAGPRTVAETIREVVVRVASRGEEVGGGAGPGGPSVTGSQNTSGRERP